MEQETNEIFLQSSFISWSNAFDRFSDVDDFELEDVSSVGIESCISNESLKFQFRFHVMLVGQTKSSPVDSERLGRSRSIELVC